MQAPGKPLADFILDNTQCLVEAWEEFARSIPAAAHLDVSQLRDHAAKMLRVIATDLKQPQSAYEQDEKSRGHAPPSQDLRETAATSHGGERYEVGFDINALVAEYRALRATVTRLWTVEICAEDRERQLQRFNEAIDQAIHESVIRFSEAASRSKDLFLGILSHDVRTPLGAALNSAHFLLQAEGASPAQLMAAAMVQRSVKQIQKLMDDLLDVSRERLGGGFPIRAEEMDLRHTCRQVAEEAQAFHPDRAVTLAASGDLRGRWDETRLHQLLSNLVENAIRHGSAEAPVQLSAAGAGADVRLQVHNEGPPIAAADVPHIFDPMHRAGTAAPTEGVGLGLYIARLIVDAHHGRISVASSGKAGTTFEVNLPR